MKKALSAFAFSLALFGWITGCGSEPQKPVRGGGDAVVASRGPSLGPQNANTMVCAPGSFQGGNDCIPVKVAGCPAGMEQRGAECVCPAGMTQQGDGCACPPRTALQNGVCTALPSPKVADNAPLPQSKLDLEFGAQLDPRREWQSPRAKPLLITELQGLEALFASTPKDSPDRAKLLARLASGYVELESAVMRTGLPGEDYAKRDKISKAARRKAIQDYQLIVNQYPKFCATVDAKTNKGTGCIDEILYFLSLEQMRDSDLPHVRATLLVILKDWPQSAYTGHAYFLMGELLRLEAPTNPTYWDPAEKAFAKAATLKGPLQEAAKSRVADVKKERNQNTAQVAAP